jgi:hypothetical protein
LPADCQGSFRLRIFAVTFTFTPRLLMARAA